MAEGWFKAESYDVAADEKYECHYAHDQGNDCDNGDAYDVDDDNDGDGGDGDDDVVVVDDVDDVVVVVSFDLDFDDSY